MTSFQGVWKEVLECLQTCDNSPEDQQGRHIAEEAEDADSGQGDALQVEGGQQHRVRLVAGGLALSLVHGEDVTAALTSLTVLYTGPRPSALSLSLSVTSPYSSAMDRERSDRCI